MENIFVVETKEKLLWDLLGKKQAEISNHWRRLVFLQEMLGSEPVP